MAAILPIVRTDGLFLSFSTDHSCVTFIFAAAASSFRIMWRLSRHSLTNFPIFKSSSLFMACGPQCMVWHFKSKKIIAFLCLYLNMQIYIF